MDASTPTVPIDLHLPVLQFLGLHIDSGEPDTLHADHLLPGLDFKPLLLKSTSDNN